MPPQYRPLVLRVALLLILILVIYAQSNGFDRTLANLIRGYSVPPSARSGVTGQPPVFATPRATPTARTPNAVQTSGPPAGVRLPNGQCVVPNGWVPYAVEADQTLAVIAEDRGLTAEQLASANCIDNPDLIFVGQIIAVPAN